MLRTYREADNCKIQTQTPPLRWSAYTPTCLSLNSTTLELILVVTSR